MFLQCSCRCKTALVGQGKQRKRKVVGSPAAAASVEALSWKETCKKLMAVVKTHTGWNGTLLAAIHDAFDEHYNDVNTKSIIEEKPRKQQKMQAIYADIDAVLMDRD